MTKNEMLLAATASGPAVELSRGEGRDALPLRHAQADEEAVQRTRSTAAAPPTFDEFYRAYASFVWRNVCRLGVPYSLAEDVMQEVFLVVHRRLPEYEERTTARAWLSAIVIRVVRAHRRSAWRKRQTAADGRPLPDPDSLIDPKGRTPLEHFEQDEDVRELYSVISQMNEERREVLVLSELEELTAPEIADALQVNINTVYWRLRTARKEFERALVRHRLNEGGAKR